MKERKSRKLMMHLKILVGVQNWRKSKKNVQAATSGKAVGQNGA